MNICVFASGSGSNFGAILKAKRKGIIKSKINLLLTNNSGCGAVEIAIKYNIPVVHFSRKKYSTFTDEEYSSYMLEILQKHDINFIVLAGYMKLVPPEVVTKFNNRIINIHPALLPSFGGEGMYGIKVHKAVIDYGVKYSGLTIHFVNNDYDKGKIIFQKVVKVPEDVDEYKLQKKILKYEHKYYSKVIAEIENNINEKSIN